MNGRRQLYLLLMLVFASSMFVAEAKSTMEQLINREWYEFDFKTMKSNESYYVKYTGTQRLVVSADEDGNTKMRVQKYYLTNRWEERFDSTKVGKSRNGKYIMIRGAKNEKGSTSRLRIGVHSHLPSRQT